MMNLMENDNRIEYLQDHQQKIDLDIATFVLRSGGVLLYPTETVWGLGCDATDEEAVQELLNLKRTKEQKALIVLVDSIDMVKEYLKSFPQKAEQIIQDIEKPTTIIYPFADNLANNVTAPDGSIGIRITTHPFCKALIKRFKKPIVSTSANYSGKSTPATFSDVDIDLILEVDYVVRFGQDNEEIAEPSKIVKILENGEMTEIR